MRKLALIVAVMGIAAAAQAEEVKLKITGMACVEGCVKKVDNALTKLKGVSEAKVELGSATVKFDEKVTSKKAIVALIEKQGYKVAKD